MFLLTLSAIYTQTIGDTLGDIVFESFLGSAGIHYDEHFCELYKFVYQYWTVLMMHACLLCIYPPIEGIIIFTISFIFCTCRKIAQYSPSESAKVYEKTVNRRSNSCFDPKATLQKLRQGSPASVLDETARRALIEQYLDVSTYE